MQVNGVKANLQMPVAPKAKQAEGSANEEAGESQAAKAAEAGKTAAIKTQKTASPQGVSSQINIQG